MIRRFTLEEWFLDLQLRTVRDDHVHLPFTLEVPAEPLLAPWRSVGRAPSIPSLLIRAVALLARQQPVVNRLVFRTPVGPRVFEPEGVHVNVPVLVEHEGRRLLSAVVIRDAADRSVDDIHQQLVDARSRDPRGLPLNRLFLDGQDSPWRRLALRGAWFASYRLPWVYARMGGGGLAVSSIYHHAHDDLRVQGVAYGPTALTVLAVTRTPDRLHIGLGFDHCALTGDQIGAAVAGLDALLRTPTRFAPDVTA